MGHDPIAMVSVLVREGRLC